MTTRATDGWQMRPRFLLVLLAALGLPTMGRSESPIVDAKVTIKDISFTGNVFASCPALATYINSSVKPFRIGGVYDQRTVDSAVAKLEDYYRSFGFLDVEVSRKHRRSEDQRKVSLTFHINEGTRYLVKEAMTLEAVLKHAGKPKATSENSGPCHLMAVKPVRVFSFGSMRVEYEIQEHPLERVGQLFILGNTRTRMDVILKQVALYPGQISSREDLRTAEENLVRLDRFVVDPVKRIHPTVTILVNPNDPKSEYKDILITVEEKETTGLLGDWLDTLGQSDILFTMEAPVLIPLVILRGLYDGYCH